MEMELEEGKPPPLTAEEQQDKRKALVTVCPVLIISALIYMGVTGGLCLSGTVNLGGNISCVRLLVETN
jgi:hypothetical protein